MRFYAGKVASKLLPRQTNKIRIFSIPFNTLRANSGHPRLAQNATIRCNGISHIATDSGGRHGRPRTPRIRPMALVAGSDPLGDCGAGDDGWLLSVDPAEAGVLVRFPESEFGPDFYDSRAGKLSILALELVFWVLVPVALLARLWWLAVDGWAP